MMTSLRLEPMVIFGDLCLIQHNSDGCFESQLDSSDALDNFNRQTFETGGHAKPSSDLSWILRML